MKTLIFKKELIFLLLSLFSMPVYANGHFFYLDWDSVFLQLPLPEEFKISHSNFKSDSIENHVEIFNLDSEKDLHCKYPARYFYLQQKDLVSVKNYAHCKDLQEFLNRAPIHEISIMFAAESLNRPASVVGHSFLKIAGWDAEGFQKEHAISFFTRMDDVSVVKLLIQSFITGKKGYYALTPLQDTLDYYIKDEGRTVWEYKLKLSEKELEFLRLYLFELKNIKFKYYFHAFNCATILQQILSSTYPEVSYSGHLWVTPLDLVKTLYAYDRIKERQIYPSSSWLLQQIDQSQKNVHANASAYASEQQKALSYHYRKAELNFNYEQGKSSYENYKSNSEKLQEEFQDHLKYDQLSFENLKGPERTSQDSQIYLSASRWGNNQKYYRLYLLPLSHQLFNSSEGRAFESEVRLLGIDVSYFEQKGMRLRELNIFKIVTHNLHHRITGGLSGQFDLSYKADANNIYLEDLRRVEFTTSLGKTFRLHNDLEVFVWPSLKFFVGEQSEFMINPQTGLIFRQIWNMKSILTYEYQFNMDKKDLNILSLTHSINFKDVSVGLHYNHYFTESKNAELLELFTSFAF